LVDKEENGRKNGRTGGRQWIKNLWAVLVYQKRSFLPLGFRLIERQTENMTVAARAMADRKVLAHLS
jgi:hypothetical protein